MSEVTQQTTVRMPVEMHERLRREAFDSRTPANAIIVEAVREYLNDRAELAAVDHAVEEGR